MRSFKYLAVGAAIVLLDVAAVVGFKMMRPIPPPFDVNPAKSAGPADAPVLIVEFSDYACPFCADLHLVLDDLQKAFPTQLRRIHKHFPLVKHPNAFKAAEAAECAADQGQFWLMSDKLFKTTEEWDLEKVDPSPKFVEMAGSLGLDRARFQQCLDSGSKAAVALADKQDGKRLLIDGTPTILLNGTRVLTERTIEDLTTVVQEAIDEGKKGS